MSSKDQQTILLHCYSDLYRAAKAFYLSPQGKNHLVFLHHCQNELKKIQVKRVEVILLQLKEIERKIKIHPEGLTAKQKQNLADELLTLGILLRSVK